MGRGAIVYLHGTAAREPNEATRAKGGFRRVPGPGYHGRPGPQVGSAGAEEHRALSGGEVQRYAQDHSRPDQTRTFHATEGAEERRPHRGRRKRAELLEMGLDRKRERRPPGPDVDGWLRVKVVRREGLLRQSAQATEGRLRRILHQEGLGKSRS